MEISKEVLQLLLNASNMQMDDVLDRITSMKNNEILQKHPHPISQGKDGRWRTYVTDTTKPSGRRQIAKSSKAAVEEAIISAVLKQEKNKLSCFSPLRDIYVAWLFWRRDIGVDPKTITENRNEWTKFLESSSLAEKAIGTIETVDIEDFFLIITKNHAITYKRLSNVKSVLNGIFYYAIRYKLISSNPVREINFATFKKRCKPSDSLDKTNYTLEERKLILEDLQDKDEPYALAIQFAFCCCLRIGELTSLQKSDIHGHQIAIHRSQRKHRLLQDDLSFSPVQHTIENRTKGNLSSGFRMIPLTPFAENILNRAIALNPTGEYIFERDGKPILSDTFNKYLKRTCERLDIPYRSSHQIRFTNATLFAEAGVPITELSTMLGHSNTATTMHYIRQNKVSEKTANTINQLFSEYDL